MKNLTCQKCGGTDLVQQGNIYVCQHCGSKYSLDQVVKAKVSGEVEVKGKVKIDHSREIDNYTRLVETSMKAGNYSDAESYCNKLLEIDFQNYQAWQYKGAASAWQSTFAHLRLDEAIECWKNALKYCENKNLLFSYTDNEASSLITALAKLAGNLLKGRLDANGVMTYKNRLVDILDFVSAYNSHINRQFDLKQACCDAAINSLNTIEMAVNTHIQLYHKIQPGKDMWEEFMKEFAMVTTLIDSLALLGMKKQAQLKCYEKGVDLFTQINKLPFYIWFQGEYVKRANPSPVFTDVIAQYQTKVNSLRAEAEIEYWQEHPEEYELMLEEQEEERLREEQLEKEIKEAQERFWAQYPEEYKLLTSTLEKLTIEKETFNNGVYLNKSKVLDDLCNDISQVLNADRRDQLELNPEDQAVLSEIPKWESKARVATKKDFKKSKKFAIFDIVVGIVWMIILPGWGLLPAALFFWLAWKTFKGIKKAEQEMIPESEEQIAMKKALKKSKKRARFLIIVGILCMIIVPIWGLIPGGILLVFGLIKLKKIKKAVKNNQ